VPADRAEELAANRRPARLLGPAGTISAFHPDEVTRPTFLVDPDTTPVTRAQPV
jgi:ectoine hydroxylase